MAKATKLSFSHAHLLDYLTVTDVVVLVGARSLDRLSTGGSANSLLDSGSGRNGRIFLRHKGSVGSTRTLLDGNSSMLASGSLVLIGEIELSELLSEALTSVNRAGGREFAANGGV